MLLALGSLLLVPTEAGYRGYENNNHWNRPELEAQYNPQPFPSTAEVREYIAEKAKEKGVNVKTALRVAECESNFRTQVYGDSGKAFSVWQFHRPTFDEFSARYDLDLDYYNWHDQTELALEMLVRGYGWHWSCF